MAQRSLKMNNNTTIESHNEEYSDFYVSTNVSKYLYYMACVYMAIIFFFGAMANLTTFVIFIKSTLVSSIKALFLFIVFYNFLPFSFHWTIIGRWSVATYAENIIQYSEAKIPKLRFYNISCFLLPKFG